jgi:hypothetical protein
MVLTLVVKHRMTYCEAAVFMNRSDRHTLVLIRQALDRVRVLRRNEPELFPPSPMSGPPDRQDQVGDEGRIL